MIDPAAATLERVLAVLEAWAWARGHSNPLDADGRLRIGWHVARHPTTTLVSIWHRHGHHSEQFGSSSAVSPLVALAWALAVEAGERVDVGRCPACEARGCGPGRKLATHVWMRDIETGLKIGPGRGWVPGVRPCPDCNGTGRDTREVARLVLDAAPREGVVGSMYQRLLAERSAAGHLADLRPGATVEVIESPLHDAPPGHQLWAYRWCEPGDPTSIAALTVYAEKLVHTTPPCSACRGSGKHVTRMAGAAEAPMYFNGERTGSVKSITISTSATCACCRGKCIDTAGQRQRDRGVLLMHLLERWTADHWEGSEAACRMLERATEDVLFQQVDQARSTSDAAGARRLLFGDFER